jgi:hypothetical protein
MSSVASQEISLLGEKFSIRTDLSAEKLQAAMSYANQILEKLVHKDGPNARRQILLSVLFLSQEVLQCKTESHNLKNRVEKLDNCILELSSLFENVDL